MTAICVNRCLTLRRRLTSRRTVGLPATLAAQLAPRLVELDQAFSALSPRQRAVVSLHYHFGYRLDEVAALLKTRPGTVRSHLARALVKLRRELADD